MSDQARVTWRAGIMSGHEYLWRSRHRSEKAALAAARKYARERQRNGPAAGGAGAWSGFVVSPSGKIREYGAVAATVQS